MNIKAIETRYKGFRFRSRLEARWAVFFDVAEIEWQYEPEGLILPSGRRYLPDFFLPTLGLWIEIKGSWPKREEIEKVFEVGDEQPIALFCGLPGKGWMCEEETMGGSAWLVAPEGNGDFPALILPTDGSVLFDVEGEGPIPLFLGVGQDDHENGKNLFVGHTRGRDALDSARSARFEYGESGL